MKKVLQRKVTFPDGRVLETFCDERSNILPREKKPSEKAPKEEGPYIKYSHGIKSKLIFEGDTPIKWVIGTLTSETTYMLDAAYFALSNSVYSEDLPPIFISHVRPIESFLRRRNFSLKSPRAYKDGDGIVHTLEFPIGAVK